MKNKKIIIVIGIVLILVVCFVGYYIHLNSNSMEKSLEKDGYTMLDIDKLETKLEFTGELREFNINDNDNSLRTINTQGEETLYEGAKIKLANGKVTMIFGDNEESVPIADVSKVYISNIACFNYVTIYLLTNDGTLYVFDQKRDSSKIEDYQMGNSEFNLYNQDLKYTNIIEWKIRDEKCGYTAELVGITEDNERYLAALEKKFTYVNKLNNILINENRDIDYAPIQNKKFKYLLGYTEDNNEYIFLTMDKYLYSATTFYYILINQSPVKKIYNKNNKYVIIFDNNETKEYSF